MRLSKLSHWLIKQALGTRRGEIVLTIFSGPLGAILDLTLEGKPSAALAKLDSVLDSVREVIG